ncbi:MAG: GNAT family N-acetyltransferase [Deltaproteobacteria bacterium]
MASPGLSEKEFYLHSFRHRCMLIHLGDSQGPAELAAVAPVVAELVANETTVAVVAGTELKLQGLEKIDNFKLTSRSLVAGDKALVALSAYLLERGVALVTRPASRGDTGAALAFSCRLVCLLGIGKLVVVDPRGGLCGQAGRRSFVTSTVLARMASGRGGLGDWSGAELGQCQEALKGSVESLNLCTADGLADELFSYQGSGTLFTRQQYCQVGKLGLDDFPEALRLMEKGENEGFLLVRSDSERIACLLNAYGAWFEGRRLAGIAGLQTHSYRQQRLAEVTSLYAITRFQGEGVGVGLLEHLQAEAGDKGCSGMFACTKNRFAAAFFERSGFALADPSRVPAAKWKGRKKPYPLVFWKDLKR